MGRLVKASFEIKFGQNSIVMDVWQMCLQNDPDLDFESPSPKSVGQISTVQHLNAFVEGDIV